MENIINDLDFVENELLHKIVSFNRSKMEVLVNIYRDDKFINSKKIVFAQLPKSIKKVLNPR